jgi:hypothetical protein
MSVEEHFGISIPDDDASTLVTVGKLDAWVVSELLRLKRTPEVSVAKADGRGGPLATETGRRPSALTEV